MSRVPLLAAVVALLLAAQPAAAKDAQGAQDAIRLDIPECAGVPSALVRELVALEVAPRAVLAESSLEQAATSAGLRCHAGVVQVWVTAPRLSAPLQLELTLTDLAPQARPRMLALALSELIATSRLQKPPQLTMTEEKLPSPPPTAAMTELFEPQKTLPMSLQFWLGVGATRAAKPVLLAPSIAAGGVLALDQLALVADVRFDRGVRSETSAELTLNAISLALGPAWRVHGRSSQLLLGAALRAGYAGLHARSRSTAVDSDSLAGVWFGPCGQAALHLRLASRWRVRVGLELGYVTQAIRGLDPSGRALLELGGLWLAGHAGVSWGAVESGP